MPGSKTHELLTTALGENIIGLRQVQRIMKEFEDGTRTSFDCIEGSGRPKTEKRLQLVEEVKAELLADSRMSIRDLSTKFDASRQMIMDIIHNDLGFRSVHCKWIPHNLTEFLPESCGGDGQKKHAEKPRLY